MWSSQQFSRTLWSKDNDLWSEDNDFPPGQQHCIQSLCMLDSVRIKNYWVHHLTTMVYTKLTTIHHLLSGCKHTVFALLDQPL